jgi:glycosyltransferase involved in cell wall biosynthesis
MDDRAEKVAMVTEISMVFPAYNEEENIELLCESALRVLEGIEGEHEIIIVDDGSEDRTAEKAREVSKRCPEVKLVAHERNRGYAKALRTGVKAAKGELVFLSDADNQFDLNDIHRFLPIIQEADIVVGHRMNRQDSALRRFMARGFNLLVRMVFGVKARDIDCSFKLFRRRVFRKIEIDSDQFMVDTEILVKAKRYGFSVHEVGVKHFPRTGGTTTIRPIHLVHTLLGMVKLKWVLFREGESQ